MTKKSKKKRFKVENGESISDCLDRIAQEGYTPIKRFEKPIFKETDKGMEPVARDIMFEAILQDEV
ncbi:NETI motif-containing protein [Salinibacillus xinjiangensis]|uniref:NETI motif-containing protein n=1 Tax=Salinibacillus xinjiangensis TaxID=1229268 RepID=A0A6G1X9D2_9BACI|nr:NETI motif-containing protein [Salinibacillus xinjiangensis]MRG87398.1 NETI motif-containing protein [Salinibacillus xinjiangensis]